MYRKTMDAQKVAEQILKTVGGPENVQSLVHCMTRLRFTLNDESIVDDEDVKKTKGVLDVMKKNGQYQIIIGNEVGAVYKELNKLGNFGSSDDKPPENKKKQNIFSRVLDVIAGCMAPVIPALIGAAMIKVLLIVLPMIGLLSESSQTYQLLTVIGDGAFYFMPVLIGISAAKKFGTNQYYAASIALILLHPDFISFMGDATEAGETVKFFNVIPVTDATYAYSVIPIILSVWLLSYIEPLVDKITPAITKNFLKPMLVLLITMPIVMIIVGPIGAIIGEGLSDVVFMIHDYLGFIAVGLIAGIFPFIVITGMHHAFTPVKLSAIAQTGYEAFISIAELCSNMAQGAASLAVSIKSKNKDLKQTAGSSAFSALLAGITEPALYGVTLRLKKPMLGACIGAAAGGLVGGLFQLKSFGVATPAIVTIPQYIEDDRAITLLYVIITMLVTIVISFIATYIIGFEDIPSNDEEEEENDEKKEPHTKHALNTGIKIGSPAEGRAFSLKEVNDQTFSNELLGKGIAIVPDQGEIVAPFDGRIDVFFETGHAIGLKSESGVELLIHVGLDTVNLEGKYFNPKKKAGETVKKGETLLEFDIDKIKDAGYDITTPIIVTNSNEFMDIVGQEKEKVEKLENIITIV
ncbi:beta-glucoside-specific PTS transporter subunit IIABC [Oceanobacillus oncorhynchi]|nr:beta-glucoside-specific PTS transporter subunit IIABC [Oceanobacillus oncorhynchi]MDM8099105.1 beta-glucoside-specific PTS transporter subunit IIABC [Oceanobacillus oncorhynchi]